MINQLEISKQVNSWTLSKLTFEADRYHSIKKESKWGGLSPENKLTGSAVIVRSNTELKTHIPL